jgi:hypothetical protein
MRDLCAGCKLFKEIVYTEGGTERPFCEGCSVVQPLTSDEWALMLLVAPDSPWGPPFLPGDKVEARTAGTIYDGIGEVAQMSMSLEHGGTPVYPTFRVILSEKAHDQAPDEAWYTEICLQKVE